MSKGKGVVIDRIYLLLSGAVDTDRSSDSCEEEESNDEENKASGGSK